MAQVMERTTDETGQDKHTKAEQVDAAGVYSSLVRNGESIDTLCQTAEAAQLYLDDKKRKQERLEITMPPTESVAIRPLQVVFPGDQFRVAICCPYRSEFTPTDVYDFPTGWLQISENTYEPDERWTREEALAEVAAHNTETLASLQDQEDEYGCIDWYVAVEIGEPLADNWHFSFSSDRFGIATPFGNYPFRVIGPVAKEGGAAHE